MKIKCVDGDAVSQNLIMYDDNFIFLALTLPYWL